MYEIAGRRTAVIRLSCRGLNAIMACRLHCNSTPGSASPYTSLLTALCLCIVMIALGIEGSANKVGVGIVRDDGTILANPRHTYALLHVRRLVRKYSATSCGALTYLGCTQVHHPARARLPATADGNAPPGARQTAARQAIAPQRRALTSVEAHRRST